MKTFSVVVIRKERLTYVVDADDADGAQAIAEADSLLGRPAVVREVQDSFVHLVQEVPEA